MDFCFCFGDLEISACLTRHLLSFWSTGKFFENLHEGVATGKAPKLTQFLVEQTTRCRATYALEEINVKQ